MERPLHANLYSKMVPTVRNGLPRGFGLISSHGRRRICLDTGRRMPKKAAAPCGAVAEGDETLVINDPAVVAEVRRAFDAYEGALTANDTATLDALFWDHEAVIRYGAGEVLKGIEEIRAFRQARSTTDLARTLTDVVVTTYGDSFATAFCEYQRTGSGRRGRQSQTWLRTDRGWRIVAAHVSLDGQPAGGA